MRLMKPGSIGEMPPRTRGNVGWTERMALAASTAISAYRVLPGSSARSQCDLLLGSFQILAASIMLRPCGPGRLHRDMAACSAGTNRHRIPGAPRSRSPHSLTWLRCSFDLGSINLLDHPHNGAR